jgi:hypothetical protein
MLDDLMMLSKGRDSAEQARIRELGAKKYATKDPGFIIIQEVCRERCCKRW